MRTTLAMLILSLAACGADGPPEPVPPSAGDDFTDAAAADVTVSGTASIGVSGSF